MTCEEVREMVTTRPFELSTRGERAAIVAHVIRCPECDRFIDERSGDKGPPQGEIDIMRRDLEDPEFRETIE